MKPSMTGTKQAVESLPPASGNEQTPAAPDRTPSGRLSNHQFAALPKLQQSGKPGDADSGEGTRMPEGPHKKKGPARRAGGHGKQPPGLPPTDQRPDGAGDPFPDGIDPHAALDHTMRAMQEAGLGQQALPWLELLAEQVEAIDQLSIHEISGILTRLAAQMESLRDEKAPALADQFRFLDRSALADKRIQRVLEALERHIADHPPLDEDQFGSLTTWLANSYLLRYEGTALCCLALMIHIDPDRGVPGTDVLQPFLGWCLDVLRHQASGELAEKLCCGLTPHLVALCPACTDQDIEEILWYRGLPALQHQRTHPGSRDLLHALMPYVERFFDWIIPASQNTAPDDPREIRDPHLDPTPPSPQARFAGFDVLDALRGVKKLRMAAGDQLIDDLGLILTRINAAVTAHALDTRYSERLADPRFADSERWIRPNHENVLANLIDDVSGHFSLEAARGLVSSVYDWLAINRQRFPLDPARLTDRAYRDDLITSLRTAQPETP